MKLVSASNKAAICLVEDLKVLAVLLAAAFLSACGSAPVPSLNAVFHQQQADEYRATSRNVFAFGRHQLARALVDSTWTSSIEQGEQGPPYPDSLAIILDVDETVLNNSAFYARKVVDSSYVLRAHSREWITQARAGAIAGADGLIRYALDRGVTVFLVSNRSCTLDDSTLRNLERLGFPADHPRLLMLSRNVAFSGSNLEIDSCPEMESLARRVLDVQEPRWYAFKGYRRAAIAKKFRILLLFGDSQGDFYSLFPDPKSRQADQIRLLSGHLTVEERAAIEARHGEKFADRWMTIPNVMYGKWLESHVAYQEMPARQLVRELSRQLRVK